MAPRLVLTAAHVLGGGPDGPPPGRVTVCRPDVGDRQVDAVVRWYRLDHDIDAALIHVVDGERWDVPESLTDLRTRPPQRWGRLIGTRPHQVSLVGFPRVQRLPGGRGRVDGQLAGHILPGSGGLARRYEIFSQDPTRPEAGAPDTTATPWSGVSGAAVLSESRHGGLLCGVVRLDRGATGGTWLTATPAAALVADDGFRALVAEHSGWEPLLEPAEPADLLEPAAPERDLRSPAMLLRADAEVVRFHGREVELRELEGWCRHHPHPFSVRVVTGPGGQGKSRLARRLTDILRDEGWVTGHLRATLRDRDVSDADLKVLDTALPFLLVVDYADARPELVRRLVEHLRATRHRTRVLLLARSDGGWRQDGLSAAYADEILAGAPVTALAPLTSADGPSAARTALFTDAVTDFARLLDRFPDFPGRPVAGWAPLAGTLRPPPGPADGGDDSVLSIQVSALTTLLQYGTAPVGNSSDDPAAVLLRHEQRYWFRSAGDSGGWPQRLPAVTLQVAVAVATLCGAADQAEAEATLRRVPNLPAAAVQDVAAWLHSLYPPGEDRYWGPLQPDRLGEHHACRILFDPEARLPLAALLTDASADQQIQLLTVLVRAATVREQAGSTARAQRIERELLDALGDARLHPWTLRRLGSLLPYGEQLRELGLAVAAETVAVSGCLMRDDTSLDAIVGHALSLKYLGARLDSAQRHAEAVRAHQRAVELLRRAAEADHGYGELHAGALHGLYASLRAVGREREALAALDEAVDLLTRIADEAAAGRDARDDFSGPGWRLTRLEPDLWEAGRHDQAVRVLRRGTELLRPLAAPSSGNEVYLASVVGKLGVRLMQTGHLHDALLTMQETVERTRLLARADPAGFEPWLVSALVNLNNVLRLLGRDEEAIDALKQAVGIMRHRIRIGLGDDPGEQYLALWTAELGHLQAEAGHDGEALETLGSAVGIWRRLARADAERDEASFARALLSVCQLRFQENQYLEALEAAAESVDVWRRAVKADPDRYAPRLAGALAIQATLRFLVDDLPGALGATGEAAEIHRGLVATRPEEFTSLRRVLDIQALVLDGLGRTGEAAVVRAWLAAHPVVPPDAPGRVHSSVTRTVCQIHHETVCGCTVGIMPQ
ncbi:trypsin-like peptidase domain-containing protein [Streptomyces sp. TRM70350]|nr:trypsin-like peptidase domain-containing protein [Streptomyces sp. TRM70350]